MSSAPSTGTRRPGLSTTAGELVAARLATQRDALRDAEADQRRGEPEGVHDLRVAMRRIRSALATFRPLVDTQVTEPVRAELRWAGDELGRARDAEVVVERVTRWVEDEPGLVVGRGPDRLVLAAVEVPARSAAVEVGQLLASARYVDAVGAVDGLVERTPLTAAASGAGPTVVGAAVQDEADRLWRKVAHARAASIAEARAPLLHDVRKAAKRLRYAAEVGAAHDPDEFEAVVDAAAQVQSILGSHHDSLVTSETVRGIAAGHDDAGVVLACGRIAELEAREGERLESEAWAALARLELLTRPPGRRPTQ